MALINWDESYSVKVKEIDDQHKKWIGMINDLHEAMKAGQGSSVIGKTIDEVVNYTVYHFGHEEKLFEKYIYPDTVSHKKLHYDFVNQFRKIKQDYDSGSIVLSMDVINRLKNWLTNHIMKVDKQYSEFLNSKGIK